MARKKKKNIIDVPETRKFLNLAYGMKSREITDYEIEVFHEEVMAIFEWYHTKGTLIVRMKTTDGIEYDQLGRAMDGEEAAIAIQNWVYKMLKKKPELYRDPSLRKAHKQQLKAVMDKIQCQN